MTNLITTEKNIQDFIEEPSFDWKEELESEE
jgi:hypothetical protein